ncbi:hypothetical protein [Clostridium sp. 1xD42-85]|uniref:hypothetical protein n=1 Tax=Clostridium sp. 1xD42-85 TaxID=2320084 RepID=UPI001A9B132C|nr:hypothetical protein [Clostridium sp. 1xD42-85]
MEDGGGKGVASGNLRLRRRLSARSGDFVTGYHNNMSLAGVIHPYELHRQSGFTCFLGYLQLTIQA